MTKTLACDLKLIWLGVAIGAAICCFFLDDAGARHCSNVALAALVPCLLFRALEGE